MCPAAGKKGINPPPRTWRPIWSQSRRLWWKQQLHDDRKRSVNPELFYSPAVRSQHSRARELIVAWRGGGASAPRRCAHGSCAGLFSTE